MPHAENRTASKRNPLIVLLLALLVPTFGQIYNGQIKKGLIFLLIMVIIPVLFGITRIGIYFNGLLFIAVVNLAFRIFVIFDAVRTAKNQEEFIPKKYNNWYYHLLFIVGIWTILWFYDSNYALGIQTYNIPTTSSEPTIKIGDKVAVDLRAFRRLSPNYGDLVTFQKKDSLNPSIYRVIGIPNDSIIIHNNTVTINGKVCETTFIKKSTSEQFAVKKYKEKLPNGFIHNIYKFETSFETNHAVQHFNLRKDEYFLLGDNRDNAYDSRFFGVIKEDEIKGKVLFVLWGETSDRINVNLLNK